MIPKEAYFRTAHEKIICETLDGETLILDLARGLYFSLNKSGSLIWQSLISGRSFGETVADYTRCYRDQSDTLAEDCALFSQSLLDYSLLTDSAPHQSASRPTFSTGVYERPLIEKHSDLEALLLADPIHEFRE